VTGPAADVSKSPGRIAGMFDRIAARYDLLNHLLSAGIDRRWRARAIQSLRLQADDVVLDLCTGTADLAIAAAREPARIRCVVGIDFAGGMLDVARAKIAHARLDRCVAVAQADATRVPIGTGAVDAVTIAFGIRNVEDMAAVCREMHRVLAPGGRLAVLEFAVPSVPLFGPAYAWYLHRVLPRVGRLISRDESAYSYLAASIDAFAAPDEFVKMLRQAGFAAVRADPLTFGTVILYTARRDS
jgi:demethylmenaquinone methyltransferase / 2-methoxy-6-polyprenyl-1,4-benzoquinol methylase